MARYWFGGGIADWAFSAVTVSSTPNLAQVTGGSVITFWSAETGGSQYTDLLDSDGAPVMSIMSSDGTGVRAVGQVPPFQGPDNVVEMWASATGGPRSRMLAMETPAGAQAKADAAQALSAQRAANLSDLADAAAARTNLGLGNAATRDVGTTAGTVAAGDALAAQLKMLDVDSIYHFGHSYVIGGAVAGPVGGWNGTATLTAGSTTVGSATTTEGTAAVGDVVEGRGIVPGTTVVTIDGSNRPATLSAPATLSITGAAISTGAVIAARFGTRVARVLHATTNVNLGVSGSQAWLQGAAQGGFATVYQAITQVRNSAPYLATLSLATLFTGVNDLRAYDNLPLLKHALRVMVSRIRCAAVFEESHSSVAFTAGTWTDQVNASAFMSGGAGKVCSTPSTGVITLTMPADIPANSTISIFHAIVGDQQTFRTDGVYRYQRSGTTLATLDTRNLVGTSSNFGAVCQRLTGINPGDVISIDWPTPPPAGGKVYFDCWVLEAPTPPLVLMCKQPEANDYLSPAVAVTDQRVADFNAMLDALAGEFGPSVVTVDLSVMDHNPSVFSSDGLHPNLAGHGVIADAVLAAIRSNASRIPAASSVMTTRRY